MRQVLVQLKPESVEDLIAVISLYRPGPMDSIPKYIRNRHNPQEITYKTPLLKRYSGCHLRMYRLSGAGHADLPQAGGLFLRTGGPGAPCHVQKRSTRSWSRSAKLYLGSQKEDGSVECVGCVANGISEQVANELFDEMSSFASYAFNKSHAAAYAIVAYRTAYLKAHYPMEIWLLC